MMIFYEYFTRRIYEIEGFNLIIWQMLLKVQWLQVKLKFCKPLGKTQGHLTIRKFSKHPVLKIQIKWTG